MEGQPGALDGRPIGPRPSFGLSIAIRGDHLAWLIGILVTAVVVVLLGRVVLDAASAAARVDELRAANAALRAHVDALVAEKELVVSPIFVEVAGRGQGYGQAKERAFGLEPGSPPPSPILVEEDPAAGRPPPLEAWLSLLFGP